MVKKVSSDIAIEVEVFYQDEYSKPLNGDYIFAYRITIHNHGEHTVQLLDRHWYIFDSVGSNREVKGEGVVGEQPILKPGENHQYISGCHLNSDVGSMHGYYTMERKTDDLQFTVEIPKFKLIAEGKLN